MSIKKAPVLVLLAVFLFLAGCSGSGTVSPTPPDPSPSPAPSEPAPADTSEEINQLRQLISREQLFSYIADLTAIEAYSGWRNSATQGESEALEYITGALGGMAHLRDWGLEIEQQSFHVYLATEIWESRLFLSAGEEEFEVPVNAISGHRTLVEQALYFDSDGGLNDADRDPQEAAGDQLVLRSVTAGLNLSREDVQGKLVFVDFSAIGSAETHSGAGGKLISKLIQDGAVGIILVTESGLGKGAPDGTYLEEITADSRIPMLCLRLEDISAVGSPTWETLENLESVRLVWDTDVFSPGTSGNLVARIPGQDPSRAVILGAHIDSANTPGAGDNALNAAVLLELARVIDEARLQPPVDLYLAWFGSHELGFYGSQHFVNTHQELLDRTLAAFVMDGFTADEAGPTIFGMQESSFTRFGNTELPFSRYLEQKALAYQIPIEMVVDSPRFASDDGPFYGFVPHVRFAYGSKRIGTAFHGPYDTIEILQDQGEVMEQTAVMALIAALDAPRDAPDLRVTPIEDRRALVLATHTEALHMTPSLLINLDQALAWEGFDVDTIPYGYFPTAEDLEEADLVIVLPVIDYPIANGDPTSYDESWSAEEIDLLVGYVEHGGLLVLANSANRLIFGEKADLNEDWDKLNDLGAPFGISYENVPFAVMNAGTVSDHPLVDNISSLYMVHKNGLPIHAENAEILAEASGQAVILLADYGDAGGQVLALSDLGSLDPYDFRVDERDNLAFFLNLARYARDR